MALLVAFSFPELRPGVSKSLIEAAALSLSNALSRGRRTR